MHDIRTTTNPALIPQRATTDPLRTELMSFLTCRGTPEPFPLSKEQVEWFRRLGTCLLEFYRAKNKLYRQSVTGQSPNWIARYLDNGKPAALVEIGRARAFRDDLPAVFRPDVLLTQDGFVICELDAVPGGFGAAARLANCYSRHGRLIAGDVSIEEGFISAMRSKKTAEPGGIAIVVSDESSDYFPEMEWLSQRLLHMGYDVVATHPRKLSYTDEAVRISVGERTSTIEVVYRFMELFDLPNISKSELLLYLAKAKRIRLTPPPKAYLEEKLWFALLHHPALQYYWRDELDEGNIQILQSALPPTWILDPTPLPGQAVIPGLTVKDHPVQSWDVIRDASKRSRRMVIKPSGFSELAWGSRGVVVGHDLPASAWAEAVDRALSTFPSLTWVLQPYRAAARQQVRIYVNGSGSTGTLDGRVRLNPYYFVVGNEAKLSTILATICPAERKKIHGMRDAAMTVCAPMLQRSARTPQ